MATEKEIQAVIKEFRVYPDDGEELEKEVFDLAEALADERNDHAQSRHDAEKSIDEKNERIEELEKEIADHVCHE